MRGSRLAVSGLGVGYYVGGGEYVFHCPQCERRVGTTDTEGKLNANPAKGFWHCFRCDAKGTLKLTATDKFALTLLDSQEVLEQVEYSLPPLPKNESVFTSPDAMEYLDERGITQEMIFKYGIRRGVFGKYRDYLLLPNYEEGGLVYWAARNFRGGTPRYLNPKAKKPPRPYKCPKAKSSKVIICEGPFSALAAGPNACATYGKLYTQDQVNYLVSMNYTTYYVAYDGGEVKQSLALAKELNSYGKQVYIIELPKGKDPADLGLKQFSTYLERAWLYSETLAIKRKLNNDVT